MLYKILATLIILSVITELKAEPLNYALTVELIKEYEGYRKHTYKDVTTESIGYGINLRYGLSKDEAELILRHRLDKVYKRLSTYRWYKRLPYSKQNVVLNMGYNMGVTKLLKFKKMIKHLKAFRFKKASYEMQHSLWYKQTGRRARELKKLMEL